MWKALVKTLGLMKTSGQRTRLGRWHITDNNGIKSVLANSDHCGDTICKDPKVVSEFVKREIEAFKKDEHTPTSC